MENLKIKGHKVQLNNNRMTGDTYPIKAWIKKYLCGQWNAETKSWIVDLKQVATWTGTCIQIDKDAETAQPAAKQNNNWFVNTKHGRELAEDF